MNLTIFLIGLACIIASIVGGGLTMAGVSIPPLRSVRRQAMLAAAGVVVIVVSFFVTTGGGSSGPSAQQPSRPASSSPVVFPQGAGQVETAIHLSVSQGPVGTPLQVSGSGFGPNETVDIRFHTEALAETRSDDGGAFSNVQMSVPPDWKFTGQFDIVATGRQSIRSAREPFRVN